MEAINTHSPVESEEGEPHARLLWITQAPSEHGRLGRRMIDEG